MTVLPKTFSDTHFLHQCKFTNALTNYNEYLEISISGYCSCFILCNLFWILKSYRKTAVHWFSQTMHLLVHHIGDPFESQLESRLLEIKNLYSIQNAKIKFNVEIQNMNMNINENLVKSVDCFNFVLYFFRVLTKETHFSFKPHQTFTKFLLVPK